MAIGAIDRLVLCNRYQHTVVLIALLARRGHLTPHLEAEGIEAGSWDGPISSLISRQFMFRLFPKIYKGVHGEIWRQLFNYPKGSDGEKYFRYLHLGYNCIVEVVPK